MASMSIAFGTSSVSQLGSSQQAVTQARRAVEQAQQTATAEKSNAREARAAVERAQANVQATDARASQSAAQAESGSQVRVDRVKSAVHAQQPRPAPGHPGQFGGLMPRSTPGFFMLLNAT